MLYLDTSAIVKNYIQEPHSADVQALLAREGIVGTGLLCKAEVAAALAKAVRVQYIPPIRCAANLAGFFYRLDDANPLGTH